MKKKHLYDSGIIGNCSFLSYIDLAGSVVWQCWPNFQSSFIFGSLLDKKKGGEFSIRPEDPDYESKQYYLENTNVLATEFKAKDGRFRIIDFAPRFEIYERYHRPLMLLRKIEIISGNPSVKVVCKPTGNYGEIEGRPVIGSNHISYHGLKESVRLTTNIAKDYILEERTFALTETKYLVLSWGDHLEAPLETTFEDFLRKTIKYWRGWVKKSSVPSIYQSQVIRSGLILKLHQFEDTGAIIASGTTSLPEYPGTTRNWDYRYCWIRDSYFTLAALNSLGHFSEAEGYSHYIQNLAQKEQGRFQPVYTIDSTKTIHEKELDLEGYMGNKPVRIGNDAYTQIQNDVYGQIILSILPLYIDARIIENGSRPSLSLLEKVLNKIEEYMEIPDAGIWEYRNRKQKHAETYLFHWAGSKAALKIAEIYGRNDLAQKARKLVEESEKNLELCYDSNQKCYCTAQENKALNASEFLLITMKYLDPLSGKAAFHLEALENALKSDNDLIYRYKEDDDFGETHATFLVCAFWYAEALADLGRIDDARRVFEGLMKRSNHLGLFSEDICPQDDSQWGNYCQTYSHVGLINTAFKIAKKLDMPAFF